MKKIGTWYLVGLTALLIWLGAGLFWLNDLMVYHFKHTDTVLTPLCLMVIKTHHWPYGLAAVTFACAIIGGATKTSNTKLLHIAFWICILTIVGLFAAAVGYGVSCIPILRLAE
jgi:hypothetical protein